MGRLEEAHLEFLSQTRGRCGLLAAEASKLAASCHREAVVKLRAAQDNARTNSKSS
jgi:hypothetical protein